MTYPVLFKVLKDAYRTLAIDSEVTDGAKQTAKILREGSDYTYITLELKQLGWLLINY